MIRTERRLRLCIALLCMTLLFIWGNSMLPGEISQAFSDHIKAFLEILLHTGGEDTGLQGSGTLRKIAHFTEFRALGALLGWLFGMLRKGKLQPIMWGMAAACVDETIQFFVPGRAPGLKDVAIDTAGVLTGFVLLLIGHTLIKKKTHYNYLEDKQ